tara:strand:+ start:1451 stop:1903 length:453 start_codon:yes stop_codon:yes gene_type:complete
MATEAERELYRLHRENQAKYTYFLLAGAAAAIGFSLTQTRELALSPTHLPLGAALLCWAASFFCGCKQLQYVTSTLYDNAELLKVETGRHPLTGGHPEAIRVGSTTLRAALEKSINRGSLFGAWQFRLLIYGALLYIAWHIFEMWVRSTL